MSLSTKQQQNHRNKEQTVIASGEGGRKWDGWGVWGWQVQIITFRMDKQGDPAVQHKELYPITYDRR